MNENKIKISVILPIYNVEQYLKQSLDSVVNQTLKEIEIICVDDCSTDNSYKILQEYASKDSRFVVLKQDKNQGSGAARNRALDIAKGEYIMFLDPDDWFELDACELCYNQIKENNNDLVVFKYNKFYEKYEIKEVKDREIKPFLKAKDKKKIIISDLETNYLVSAFIWRFCYKKELINSNNIRFHNHHLMQDQPFFIEIFICANDISVIDKDLYNYRVRYSSNTFMNTKKSKCFYDVKMDYLSLIHKYNIPKNIKNAIYTHVIKSSLFWNRIYGQENKNSEKILYNSLRKIFLSLDQQCVESDIKNRISDTAYSKYKYIVENTYEQYIKEKTDNIHKANSFIEYKKISKLLSWIFPEEEDKNKFRALCDEIDERKYLLYTQLNYPKVLKRIRNKQGKIRILFLVSDIKKWKSQSLFDIMSKYERLEPVICLYIAEKESKIENLLKNKKYFEEKGIKTIIAHDTKKNKAIDLNEFKPDIVFYHQTDNISRNQNPITVSRYALACYIPYYLNNYDVAPSDYDKSFYKFLFRYYLPNKKWKEIYEKVSDLRNLRATGNPLLDYIYLNRDKKSEKNYIIYAPHWSFFHEKSKNNMRLGTFLWNGKEILEYAKSHPEVNWAFMPDKKLKNKLIKIGYTKEEVDNYYNEWEKIAKTCYDGNYTDIFLESKLLITDADTYMSEYFYSGKPIIHLISTESRVDPIKFVQKNLNTLYKVHNLAEMYETFDRVILNSDDYKYEERMARVNSQYSLDKYAANNILNNLISSIAI